MKKQVLQTLLWIVLAVAVVAVNINVPVWS